MSCCVVREETIFRLLFLSFLTNVWRSHKKMKLCLKVALLLQQNILYIVYIYIYIRLGLYSHYRCKEIAAETVGTVIHIIVLCYLLVGSRLNGNLWKIVGELKSLPGQHKLEDTQIPTWSLAYTAG